MQPKAGVSRPEPYGIDRFYDVFGRRVATASEKVGLALFGALASK